MKNVRLFVVAIMALSVHLFVSCKSNEPEKMMGEEAKPIVSVSRVMNDTLIGSVSKDLTLDAKVKYKLVGALVVQSGAKLTIPAGTVIEATASDDLDKVRYIAIAQGAKIDVQGTKEMPVVMTSQVKKSGSWGGLVICGKAPQNGGGKAGVSTSEVGGLVYGGTVSDDNSGSIKYLRVEYTGKKYSDLKEFNGVSFFGVGSGTVVENLSSYKGGDDGIEFFGGTVNAKFLVSIDSEDDGIDFADGWNGMGDMWYVYNAAKSGIEGSNSDLAGDAKPLTTAKLKNLTIYKMQELPWLLKDGAGMQMADNVVIGGLTALSILQKKTASKTTPDPYFYAKKSDKFAQERIAKGDIVFTNVKFVDMGEGNTIKAVDGLTIGENPKATGAGSMGAELPVWAMGWAKPE